MAFPITKHNKRNEKIGRLRHQAKILSYTTTKDAAGGEIPTWATGTDFFCAFDFVATGSDDELLADRLSNTQRAKLDCRYRLVTTTDRILFDGQLFEIENISPDSHKRWLTMELVKYEPE